METAETYNATAIRVLSESEILERMPFAQIADLERRYPCAAPDFIARMAEACQLSGWPLDQAERRYLVGDRTVEVPSEFVEAHAELVRDQYRKRGAMSQNGSRRRQN